MRVTSGVGGGSFVGLYGSRWCLEMGAARKDGMFGSVEFDGGCGGSEMILTKD